MSYIINIHCGIDFNLMERGDSEYREKCLAAWLNENCTEDYKYNWSSPDEFEVVFTSEQDMKKALVLQSGIPNI